MKFLQRLTLFVLFGAFASFVSCNSSQQSGTPDFGSKIDSVSYSLGFQNGRVLKQQNMSDIDVDMLVQGLHEGLKDSTNPPFPETAMRAMIQNYQMSQRQQAMQQQKEEAKVNKKKGEDFMAENIRKEGVHQTESGLQYKVLEEGSGPSPDAKDTVTVNYRGTLLDGTQFDSSYDRGEPATFPLNRVIEGWTEGVQLMKEGAKYKFWIPSDLAYGDNPRPGGPIKPGQTLVFEVELLEVK